MNNLRHYIRGLKHELLKASALGGQPAVVAALAPQNTGSPLEDAKEAMTDYALTAVALALYDADSIGAKVTAALGACTYEDVSQCLTPTLPELAA